MKKEAKIEALIEDLGALLEENAKLRAFAKDGVAVAEFILDASRATSRRISNEEIFELMRLVDPDLTRIHITEQFSENPIVLLTKGGQAFEGVIVGLREGSVRLRLPDGKVVGILKTAVVALRRP